MNTKPISDFPHGERKSWIVFKAHSSEQIRRRRCVECGGTKTVFFPLSHPHVDTFEKQPSHQQRDSMSVKTSSIQMEFYLEDRRQIPASAAPRRGQGVIGFPPGAVAKVLLLNKMLRQQPSPLNWRRHD